MNSKLKPAGMARARRNPIPKKKEPLARSHYEAGKLVMEIDGKRYIAARTRESITWVPEEGTE